MENLEKSWNFKIFFRPGKVMEIDIFWAEVMEKSWKTVSSDARISHLWESCFSKFPAYGAWSSSNFHPSSGVFGAAFPFHVSLKHTFQHVQSFMVCLCTCLFQAKQRKRSLIFTPQPWKSHGKVMEKISISSGDTLY